MIYIKRIDVKMNGCWMNDCQMNGCQMTVCQMNGCQMTVCQMNGWMGIYMSNDDRCQQSNEWIDVKWMNVKWMNVKWMNGIHC